TTYGFSEEKMNFKSLSFARGSLKGFSLIFSPVLTFWPQMVHTFVDSKIKPSLSMSRTISSPTEIPPKRTGGLSPPSKTHTPAHFPLPSPRSQEDLMWQCHST